jgi:hypothetical protein
MPRFICVLLGRHKLLATLVRRTDGRMLSIPRCASCGAAY